MGYSTAYGLASSTDMKSAISLHFQTNCYPPVPQYMVEPAEKAVEAVAEDNETLLIDLPKGVLWKGRSTAPAHAVVDDLRLDGFVSYLVTKDQQVEESN